MHDRTRTACASRLQHIISGVAFGTLALFVVTAPAHAASIVFRFHAEIQGGDNADGLLDPVGGLNLGSTVSGYFVVDDTVADSNGSANFGSYQGAVIGMAVDLGSLELIYLPLAGSTNDTFVLDDFVIGPGPVDGYATDVLGAPASLGATVFDTADFHFTLASSDTSILSSDAVPGAQPTAQAGAFDRFNEFTLSGMAGSDSFSITGIITQVPEPGTAPLVALGLSYLAIRRRR